MSRFRQHVITSGAPARSRTRARARLGSLVAAAIVLLVTPATPALSADGDETIRLGLVNEPANGQNPFSSNAWYPQALIYEQLTGMGLDGEVVPGFAESWAHSEDGKVWTFKIAADKRWSDDTPATAKDVAFTFNYLLESVGTPNELKLGFNSVAGMLGIVDSVQATDDQTVVFTLSQPSIYPQASHIWIVPEHVWGDVSHKEALTSFTNDSPTVGSGPFISTEFRSEELVRLVPNPNCSGDGPYAKEMIISTIKTADSAAQALLQGEIDAVQAPPIAMLDQLDADPNVVAQSSASPFYVSLSFNNKGKAGGAVTDAVTDMAFRDALGYALDRQALVDTAMLGNATVSHSPVCPLLPVERARIETDLTPIKRTFDLEEAKRRLEAAGYVDSNGDGIREDLDGNPLELKLIFNSAQAVHVNVAQFVTDWLVQAGLSVTPSGLEGGAYQEHFKSPEGGGPGWDIAVIGNWPETELARSFETWTSGQVGALNRAWYSNTEFDALVTKLKGTVDADERASLGSDLATMMYEQAPLHVLFHVNLTAAYRTDKWEGWVDQPSENGRAVDTYWPETTWQNLRLVGSEASAEPSSGASSAAPSPAASGVPTEAPPASGGDNTTLIVGAAVLAVVVAGGVLVARRRRAA